VYLLDGISFVPVLVGLIDHQAHQHDLEGGTIAGGKAGRIAVGPDPGHVPLSVHADPEHGGRRLGSRIGATAANFLPTAWRSDPQLSGAFGKGTPEASSRPKRRTILTSNQPDRR
jgi:hypothetical protein